MIVKLTDDQVRAELERTGIPHIKKIFDQCLGDAYEDAETNVKILRLFAESQQALREIENTVFNPKANMTHVGCLETVSHIKQIARNATGGE